MGRGGSRRTSGIAILGWILVPSATLGGCSFFTSLDGLSGGSAGDAAAGDSSTCATCDGGADSAGNIDGDGGSGKDGSKEPDGSDGSGRDGSVPPGSFLCGTDIVSSCSDCPGSPQPCMTCNNSGATSPLFCVPAGDGCRDDTPPGYDDFKNGCDCSGGADDCPQAFQVCHNSQFCHTCGEPMSDGEPCQPGGTCSGTTCN